MQNAVWTYQNTMGLFRQGRYLLLLTAAINLCASIWLVGFGACLGFTLRPHCQDFLRICGTIPISSSNMGFTRAWAPMPKDISLTLGWCVLLDWFAGCFAEWHNFRCYPMCWSNVRSAVWSQMCFLCCRFVGARSLLI